MTRIVIYELNMKKTFPSVRYEYYVARLDFLCF